MKTLITTVALSLVTLFTPLESAAQASPMAALVCMP